MALLIRRFTHRSGADETRPPRTGVRVTTAKLSTEWTCWAVTPTPTSCRGLNRILSGQGRDSPSHRPVHRSINNRLDWPIPTESSRRESVDATVALRRRGRRRRLALEGHDDVGVASRGDDGDVAWGAAAELDRADVLVTCPGRRRPGDRQRGAALVEVEHIGRRLRRLVHADPRPALTVDQRSRTCGRRTLRKGEVARPARRELSVQREARLVRRLFPRRGGCSTGWWSCSRCSRNRHPRTWPAARSPRVQGRTRIEFAFEAPSSRNKEFWAPGPGVVDADLRGHRTVPGTFPRHSDGWRVSARRPCRATLRRFEGPLCVPESGTSMPRYASSSSRRMARSPFDASFIFLQHPW